MPHSPLSEVPGVADGGVVAARAVVAVAVPYYHVVFTLPAAVAAVVWQNRRVGYTLLFQAVHDTLREVAAQPKHLGAQVGLLAVLHTWGQDLHYHPHLHVVATGGGLACDSAGKLSTPSRWQAPARVFLPVRVLSRVYRGKYLAGLRQAYTAGQLTFHGELAGLLRLDPKNATALVYRGYAYAERRNWTKPSRISARSAASTRKTPTFA